MNVNALPDSTTQMGVRSASQPSQCLWMIDGSAGSDRHAYWNSSMTSTSGRSPACEPKKPSASSQELKLSGGVPGSSCDNATT